MTSLREKKKTVTLTPTSMCNLNCSYCYVDKTDLKEAEKRIKQSFDGDYYFDLCKRLFPNKDELGRLELWGGEPLLFIERPLPVMKKIIEYYECINEIFFSTNFALIDANEKLFTLLKFLSQFKDRKFFVKMQISCDGDEDIMSLTRGKGTVQKIINNVDKLVSISNDIPDNCQVSIFMKPTISIDIINEKFVDKNYQINYCKFYENFYKKILNCNQERLSTPKNPNLYIGVATPFDYTQEQGIKFAEVIKVSRQIEKENITEHYFEYLKEITIYGQRTRARINRIMNNNVKYHAGSGVCGCFRHVVNLYPENYIGGCHRQIHEYIQAVNGNKTSRLLIKECDFEKEKELISRMYDQHTVCNVGSIVPMIQFSAMIGQIDKKYTERKNAITAAKFINNVAGGCIYENDTSTGTYSTVNVGLIKLWLNGAMDEVIRGVYENDL